MTQLHALSPKDLLRELDTSDAGLTNDEAKKRLAQYGPNEIRESHPVRWYHILLSQFKNIMVIILMLAAGVSLAVGEHIDAAAIGVIVIINAVVGFIQEYKAEKAVDALKKMTAPHAIVLREGKILKIAARELVPGDVIVLEEGSFIPADARLLKSAQLQSIEASLTGESAPVQKSIEPIENYDSIGDLTNMVFMGTVISQGHGQAVVTRTGMETEFGKIAKMVQSEDKSATPLQLQLDKLTKLLAVIVLSLVGVLFLTSVLVGRDLLEMFMLSISLAVSVIPEGLPAIITLTLAIGVQQMAKENAIIRKLPAAETLGSTSVICSDKTGTLTQNQMTVQKLWVDEDERAVSGLGYKPKGDIEGESSEALSLLLKAASLCNNAKLVENKGRWEVLGDPTEACLLTLAYKGGIDPQKLEKKEPRQNELVFDSERKRMSTVNNNTLLTKGAPDTVLSVCTHAYYHGKVFKLTDKMKANIMKVNDSWAKEAFRVLAFAYKPMPKDTEPKEDKMIFVGLVGMMDPPRREVKEAIEICRSANINVVMITGDHALTAQAVGEQIGLYQKGDRIITGAELEQMSDAELQKVVDKIRIYARVNPKHKVKVLKALQSKRHIVAMTGDGVNDAPALKSANIGVAMGITGTDVAQESSEMILTDDNFATIVKSIERGRSIYRNIKKFIRYSLSGNFDEVLFIFIVFLLGFPIPFLPLQILWINLLTDSFPGIALGLDPKDDDVMSLKPRDPKSSIWRELLLFSMLAGMLSTVASLVLYFTHINTINIEKLRTMIVSLTVISKLFLAFSVRYEDQHLFTHFFQNKFLLGAVGLCLGLQIFAIYNPWMQEVLGMAPLTATEWLWVIGMSLLPCAGMEIWKQFKKKPTHV